MISRKSHRALSFSRYLVPAKNKKIKKTILGKHLLVKTGIIMPVKGGFAELMAHYIIQWNVRCFQGDFEELTLLARRYRPAIFGL